MSDTIAPGTASSRLPFPERHRTGFASSALRIGLFGLFGLFGLAAMATLAVPAKAAPRKPTPPAPLAFPPAADFRALSGAYPSACSADIDPALAGLGEPTLRHCAWSQRIEMQYWQAIPSAGACLAAPALAWQHLGAGLHATVAPWDAAWSGQGAFLQDASQRQAAALWRRPDGQWSAVLWRWQPAERLDTRSWQENNWNKVTAALEALGADSHPAPRTPLMSAWLDASRGKPRLIEGETWRWIADGACLGMQNVGAVQARLHLPYSRDDVRQEQRSAMQVLLARRFPNAEWIRPFSLVEPATPGARSGAKFLAVWRDGAALHGQLWIALRDEGGIVRTRISSDAPAQAADDEPLKARSALIERELTTLAHAWEARHE